MSHSEELLRAAGWDAWEEFWYASYPPEACSIGEVDERRFLMVYTNYNEPERVACLERVLHLEGSSRGN